MEGLSPHEKMRIRAAAYRVLKLLPPGMAKLLSRELLTWEEFGYRLGDSSAINMAVDEILKMRAEDPRHPAGESAVGYGE